jgi:predicted dehydrogenase
MNRPLRRRDFMKQAGTVATGFWITGRQTGFGQERSPNAKLHVASIGVGGRGRASLDACNKENIVAVCDIDDKPLDKACKDFPNAKRYNDYRKMLEEIGKEIDAVTVGTPDHHHAPAAARAMALGKHAYVEKPLTHNVYEARVLADLAAKHKLATQMGTQGHASPKLRRVVELVQSGVLGAVREAHTWSDRPIWPQGIDRPKDTPPVPGHLHWDLWLGPAPERPYHPCYHPFKWRGWWDFGTGALGDMACHIMDPVFWALTLGAPKTVEAEGEPHHPETGPLWCIIHYEFGARGEQPPVKLTWYDGLKLPPMELTPGIEKLPKNGAIFVGEKGTLLAYDEGVSKYKLFPEEKFVDVESQVKPTLPKSPGHHAEWIEACKGGTAALSNFAYASNLTESVLLGNVAFRAGKKIEWDSANLKVTNCPEAAQLIKREYRKGWEV